MDLNIVFEDPDILVIDKPSGFTVNTADTTRNESTIQEMVQGKIKFEEEESEFKDRGGIVHRLDKETSGVLIVAKNQNAFENLQSQFKERIVKKEYIALSHGEVIPAEGEISVPVGRLPWNRKRFGVLAGGRESKTMYKVIEVSDSELGKLSLLKMNPLTGRTHQIRVHLKYINHPIFGDFLYAGRKVSRTDRKILERVFLHARSIKFNHPTTGEEMELTAKLPKELKDALKVLKFNEEVN